MKRSSQLFRVLLVAILCGHQVVHSQDSLHVSLLTIDVARSLPPLELLIDSALKNDPKIQFRDLQLIVNNSKLKASKLEWTRNMGLQSDIRYGTFDNFSTNTSEGQTVNLLATRSNQTNYGVGLYLKFPIDDIVGRKHELNLARAELSQAEQMAEAQRQEVRQLIIKQYNEVLLNQRLLVIRSNYYQSALISREMAEQKFRNGVGDLTEYTRISEISTRAEADYEISRSEFISSYLILEDIAGFRFSDLQPK